MCDTLVSQDKHPSFTLPESSPTSPCISSIGVEEMTTDMREGINPPPGVGSLPDLYFPMFLNGSNAEILSRLLNLSSIRRTPALCAGRLHTRSARLHML